MIQVGPRINLWIHFDNPPGYVDHCHTCDLYGNPTRDTLCGQQLRGHWQIDVLGNNRCKTCDQLFDTCLKK